MQALSVNSKDLFFPVCYTTDQDNRQLQDLANLIHSTRRLPYPCSNTNYNHHATMAPAKWAVRNCTVSIEMSATPYLSITCEMWTFHLNLNGLTPTTSEGLTRNTDCFWCLKNGLASCIYQHRVLVILGIEHLILVQGGKNEQHAASRSFIVVIYDSLNLVANLMCSRNHTMGIERSMNALFDHLWKLF